MKGILEMQNITSIKNKQNFCGIRLVEGTPCQINKIGQKLVREFPERIQAANISSFSGKDIKACEHDIVVVTTGPSPEWKLFDDLKEELFRGNITGRERMEIIKEKLGHLIDFSKPPQEAEEMLEAMDHADYNYLELSRNISQNLN